MLIVCSKSWCLLTRCGRAPEITNLPATPGGFAGCFTGRRNGSGTFHGVPPKLKSFQASTSLIPPRGSEQTPKTRETKSSRLVTHMCHPKDHRSQIIPCQMIHSCQQRWLARGLTCWKLLRELVFKVWFSIGTKFPDQPIRVANLNS
jgi:hypothetical protein